MKVEAGEKLTPEEKALLISYEHIKTSCCNAEVEYLGMELTVNSKAEHLIPPRKIWVCSKCLKELE